MRSRCALIAKVLLAVLGVTIVIGILVVGIRTIELPYRKIDTDLIPAVDYEEKFLANDTESLQKHLEAAIGFKTVSYDSDEDDQNKLGNSTEAFKQFRKFITNTFITDLLKRSFISVLNDGKTEGCTDASQPSFLMYVKGTNQNLAPYLLCAHMDVVPADDLWENGTNPFEARVDYEVTDGRNDTFIYGRGTLDDKHNLMSILEVLHQLTEQPARSFYVALGHDEEISGTQGAVEMAKCLGTMLTERHNGTKFAFIMDEGLFVMNGSFPMLARPLACIGVAEKGFLSLNISTTAAPGHSSLPPKETAITKLARAVSRFTNDAFPTKMTRLQRDMIWQLAPYASFPANIVMANMWLFGSVVQRSMAAQETASAFMRTTTAVTRIRGGVKTNVVPGYAEAIINHRVLPGFTLDDTIKRDLELVKDIPNITLAVLEWKEPIETNPINGSDTLQSSDTSNLPKEIGLLALRQTISVLYPSAIVVPMLMMGGTDSRHYTNLTHYIYRFSPLNIDSKDTAGIHGDNERISVDQYRSMCNFYWHLVRTMDVLPDTDEPVE